MTISIMIKFVNILIGFSAGLIVAAGVFTVLFVVGLVPRFAGKTHTAQYELVYENFIILGTVFGSTISIFEISINLDKWVQNVVLIITGIFSGIFVGCLAMAAAELLDSIPIFARRTRLKKGLGIAVIAAALGKIAGSLIYFYFHF